MRQGIQVLLIMIIFLVGCVHEKLEATDTDPDDLKYYTMLGVSPEEYATVQVYTNHLWKSDYYILQYYQLLPIIVEDVNNQDSAYNTVLLRDKEETYFAISYADIVKIEGLAGLQQLHTVLFHSVKFSMTCEDFTSQVIEPLSQASITTIRLNGVYFPCKNTDFLASFPSLESITMTLIDPTGNSVEFTVPRAMPQLIRIQADGEVTFDDTTFFSQTPRLQDFFFRATTSSTGRYPLWVVNQKMRHLTEIDIAGIEVMSMDFLSYVPNLESLVIRPDDSAMYPTRPYLGTAMNPVSFSLGNDYTERIWRHGAKLTTVVLPEALRPAKGVLSTYTKAEEHYGNTLGYTVSPEDYVYIKGEKLSKITRRGVEVFFTDSSTAGSAVYAPVNGKIKAIGKYNNLQIVAQNDEYTEGLDYVEYIDVGLYYIDVDPHLKKGNVSEGQLIGTIQDRGENSEVHIEVNIAGIEYSTIETKLFLQQAGGGLYDDIYNVLNDKSQNPIGIPSDRLYIDIADDMINRTVINE